MTIKQTLNWAAKKIPGPSPQLDAEVILSYITGYPREELITKNFHKLSLINKIKYWLAIKRRHRHWPVAYLTGYQEFYGRRFIVNQNVLIPRPESEQIIDLAKKFFTSETNITIADIGTGSGCLAITLAMEFPDARILASDISSKALSVAKINTQKYNLSNRINFKDGDLLKPWSGQPIDLVVANLPYVTPMELKNEPSIKHEPIIALTEKINLIQDFALGLKLIFNNKLTIIETSPLLVNNWYKILLNILSPRSIAIKKDLSGKDRLILIDFR